jgi:16S rRNA (adenine1518-N6/adenine1519-N6)-dimethyltransferase
MGNLPRANKDLGQHFLTDKKVISSITNDFVEDFDAIVEIGPGPAVLSKELASKEIPYYAIEMDDRFIPQLQEITPQENIFNQDALKFQWDHFLQQNPDIKKIWLVSNLPYNISSKLLISFLTIPQIEFMTLMFQKEVGEKTYFRDQKNTMSSLFALSNTYFKTNQLMKVLPGAFSPPPKVDSVVVSYQRIDEPKVTIDEFKVYERFLRNLFAQRRKQIKANLKGQYSNYMDALEKSGIEASLRAETLNLEQIHTLFRNLTNS